MIENIPQHVAIIMDGNRRWARQNGHFESYGHSVGSERVYDVCKWCLELGVENLSLYAFSTENWNRDEAEIVELENLIGHYLRSKNAKELQENGVRIRIVGDVSKFNDSLQRKLKQYEADTGKNDKLFLNIALGYGGRDEIVRAVNVALAKGGVYQISESDISDNLCIESAPDLLIRTGGHQRLSNFMLWQMAYTEMYFAKVMWPAFLRDDFIDAINFFSTTKRNFGK